METLESPCILVCAIDMHSGYCFGCGRTREEIAGWMAFSSSQRAEIMEQLPERLKTVERKPRRITRRQARRNRLAETGQETDSN